MSTEVASTLHRVLETLKIMDMKVDGVLEKVTGLECTMMTVQEDISTLKGWIIKIEKTVEDMDDGLNFINSEVENLKLKVMDARQNPSRNVYSIRRCIIDAKACVLLEFQRMERQMRKTQAKLFTILWKGS